MRQTFFAIALAMTLTAPGEALAAQGGQPRSASDQRAVETLGNELVVIARRLPDNADPQLIEAQYALVFDQYRIDCPLLIAGLDRAVAAPRMTEQGRAALIRLRDTIARCNVGTGAIGGAAPVTFPSIGFAVGGGSDYR